MPDVEAAEKDRFLSFDGAKVGIILGAKKQITYFGYILNLNPST